MSTAPKYAPHYTVDDYQLWKGDWELWHGTAVAMTPSPFGRHSHLLSQFTKILGNAIDASKCEAVVLPEIDWIISDDTVLRPDLILLCGPVPERHVEETPALVVEILSKATRERDLTYKRDIYQDAGVRWYLIADPETNLLTAMRLDENGQYVVVDLGESLAIDICESCKLSILVDHIFV